MNLYGKTKTGTGSLFNLAAHLSVSNLPKDAKKDLNRVEDFLTTVTEAHVVAALETLMKNKGGPEAVGDDPESFCLTLVDELLESFVDYKFREVTTAQQGQTQKKKKKKKKIILNQLDNHNRNF